MHLLINLVSAEEICGMMHKNWIRLSLISLFTLLIKMKKHLKLVFLRP